MTPPATPSDAPPDQAARHRIAHDLDSTLFVEAGAGSGKTTALVGRVVALVASGTTELRSVAAITFTEKAAAELRDRVRIELQVRAADPTRPAEEAARCAAALDQVDGAAIGTLHAFAQRILREHPVEAQLPPRVDVLDEVSSGVAFDRRFTRVLDALLGEPALARTLLLLHAAGVHPRRLRSLAQAFDDAWDLVEQRVPADAPEPPPLRPALEALRAPLDDLLACCPHCIDEGDGLLQRIEQLRAYVEVLLELDELDAMELLSDETARPSVRVTRTGNKNKWRCTVDDVRAKVVELGAAIDRARQPVLEACAHRLGAAMRRHTIEAAHRRRAAGELEFHDLLVLARKVLADPTHGPEVRASVHQRYQRLLLDEFQDTDPIQIELAVRIAAADPRHADEPEWADVAVGPGRLFVVGDPKQSIYRFRRADIGTFLKAQRRFAAAGGRDLVELTANFRSVEPVISWINDTFDALLSEVPALDVPVPSQPAFVALDPERPAPPVGPPMAVLGTEAHPSTARADVLRAAEAADVAHAVTVAVRDRWAVRDGDGWRDARLGDVTILVPARTSLPFLEQALERAGIPFRTESSSLVYASRAVRDLMMVLRAADDPTDPLRIVSALRTPLLACGDDDLFRFKVLGGGSWDYTNQELPEGTSDPVVAGLTLLRTLHRTRHWASPAELLSRIADEGRAFELGFAEGRPRDVWRRLRFVVDQARAWSEATGGSLRSYLHWVDQQTIEGARVTESVLPETDDDAVRIMTIHAAKGLEFPITIVSGMSTKPQSRPNPVEVVFPPGRAGVGYKLGKDVVTEEFEAWKPIDEQMGYDERIRLLYVACTRACDHLVVSLHRAERKKEAPGPGSRTNAELLLSGMGGAVPALPDVGGEAEPLHTDPATPPSPPPPFTAWEAARAQALARAARPGTVSATALTDEGQPDPGTEALADLTGVPAGSPRPPARAGGPADAVRPTRRAGRRAAVGGRRWGPRARRAAGRPRPRPRPPEAPARPRPPAVAQGALRHGGGQRRPRRAPDHRPRHRCGAGRRGGRPGPGRGRPRTRRHDPRAGRGRPRVAQRAGGRRVTPLAGGLRLHPRGRSAPRGLRRPPLPQRRGPGRGRPQQDGRHLRRHRAELDRRVQGYRLQGAAYALAVGQATGEPVVRVTFVFLTPEGAVERHLDDVAGATAEVAALVAAGAEVEVA